MIELYLSSSRFGTITWKLEAIAQAKKLSQKLRYPYFSAMVAVRENSTLRIEGETPKLDEVLMDAMSKYIRHNGTLSLPLGDPRYNAQAAKLLQSRAENLIFVDELEEAQRELDGWSPINVASPSSMEKIIQVSVTLGRLSKIQGHFQRALSELDPALERFEAEDVDAGGLRRVLLATIGEVYCKLGRPANAQSVLVPELDCMKLTKSQNSSIGLRLQPALAESYLRNGSHDRSRDVARTVRRVRERSKEHSSTKRRFYLRASAMDSSNCSYA